MFHRRRRHSANEKNDGEVCAERWLISDNTWKVPREFVLKFEQKEIREETEGK